MNQSFIIKDAVLTNDKGQPLYYPPVGENTWTDKPTESKFFSTQFAAICRVEQLITDHPGTMYMIEPVYH